MATTTRAADQYTYVTSGATKQVFLGAGVLVAVVINKPLTGTVKLIDNTGGSTANIATIASGSTPSVACPLGRIEYNVVCGTGLIVINSATEDITVIWRQG
jgi:hypothetical protein